VVLCLDYVHINPFGGSVCGFENKSTIINSGYYLYLRQSLKRKPVFAGKFVV
jgi:hypothetical protein